MNPSRATFTMPKPPTTMAKVSYPIIYGKGQERLDRILRLRVWIEHRTKPGPVLGHPELPAARQHLAEETSRRARDRATAANNRKASAYASRGLVEARFKAMEARLKALEESHQGEHAHAVALIAGVPRGV